MVLAARARGAGAVPRGVWRCGLEGVVCAVGVAGVCVCVVVVVVAAAAAATAVAMVAMVVVVGGGG